MWPTTFSKLPLTPNEIEALAATLKEIGVWPLERWG